MPDKPCAEESSCNYRIRLRLWGRIRELLKALRHPPSCTLQMRYKFQKETFRMQHSNPIGQHSSAAPTLLDLLEKLHANDNVCDGIECGALLSIPKFRGIGKMLGRCDSRSLGIYALNLIQIFSNFLGSKLVRYSAVLSMSSFSPGGALKLCSTRLVAAPSALFLI